LSEAHDHLVRRPAAVKLIGGLGADPKGSHEQAVGGAPVDGVTVLREVEVHGSPGSDETRTQVIGESHSEFRLLTVAGGLGRGTLWLRCGVTMLHVLKARSPLERCDRSEPRYWRLTP
jgi:hypothetical protein